MIALMPAALKNRTATGLAAGCPGIHPAAFCPGFHQGSEALKEIVVAPGAKKWVSWIEQSFPELPVRLVGDQRRSAARNAEASLPVIVLTSACNLNQVRSSEQEAVVVAVCRDCSQARQAIDQGAFDVLVRPFDRHQLEQVVVKALKQRKRVRRLIEALNRNVRLMRISSRRKDELLGLLEIGKAVRKVTSSLNIDDILTSILWGLRKALQLDRVLLGLVNQERGREEFKLALGIEGSLPPDLCWPLDDPHWEQMVQRKSPILIDPKQDSSLPGSMGRVFPGTFAKCPLLVKEQVLGTIMCGRSESTVTRRELRMLRIFSEYAAIAIQNGRLYYDIIRSEEQLKQAHEKLLATEKMALIGHMAVSINHEINNPLCNISLITQTVANELGDSSPRMSRLLRDVDSNVERIQEVTRKISGMRQANLTEYLPDQMMVDLQ